MSDFNLMQVADANADIAATVAGLRALFIARGFSEHQAGDLVVAIWQKVAADTWKEAGDRSDGS